MTEYPKPVVTVDVIAIIRNAKNMYNANDAKLLLIKRANEPFQGKLALPGGFVEPDETVEEAAVRELAEETGIEIDSSEIALFGVYSKPGRDPRGWTITVTFLTYIDLEHAEPGSDAAALNVDTTIAEAAEEGYLAFDHSDIVRDYL